MLIKSSENDITISNFINRITRNVIQSQIKYMPKVTIKGKVKHLPYTKAGIKKAKSLESKMPWVSKKTVYKGKSKKK